MRKVSASLDRLVEPVVRTLTPEVARAIAGLRADPKLQERTGELAEKRQEERLAPDERDEYETNIRYGNFLAIIQAKARRMLI